MWHEDLIQELTKIEGEEAARHFDSVLLPQIFADFAKVLQSGRTQEVYNIENGASLTLVGKKPAQITEVYLNGKKLS